MTVEVSMFQWIDNVVNCTSMLVYLSFHRHKFPTANDTLDKLSKLVYFVCCEHSLMYRAWIVHIFHRPKLIRSIEDADEDVWSLLVDNLIQFQITCMVDAMQ